MHNKVFFRPSVAFAKAIFISSVIAFAMTPISGSASTSFPEKPVRLVVGFSPGGGVDVAARTLGNVLANELGQPVVIENITGAGGNIATDKVVQSDADGYTLLFGSIALSINPSLYKSLKFDPVKQLRAVSIVSTSPFILLANANSGINNVQDLVAQAKSGKDIDYASAGNGSGSHLFMQQFSDLAGIKLTHIPYRGAAPALNDVLGNQVPIVFDSIMTTLPHIKAGTLKALGLSSMKKSPVAPDVPSLDEMGVKGMDSTSWFIVFAPANTSQPVIDKLERAIKNALANPELKKQFIAMGAEVVASSAADAQKFYESEVRKWATVVNASGVRLD
ncbi:MAG TPA: tripartite tricarboxylate transporter substrate binding protein [Eoetvoesiella sp.]